MARKKLQSNFVKFENQGDAFVGQIKGRDIVLMRGKEVPQYTFTDERGGIYQMLASAGTRNILGALDIGTIVEIEYSADISTPNGMMKDFSIYELDSFEDAQVDSQ